MFGKIAGFVLGVAKWSLLAIGALVGALVWWLSSGDGKKPAALVEKPAPVVVQGESAQAVSCDCAAGAVCVGPKGGRYCLRPDGSKKYAGAGS